METVSDREKVEYIWDKAQAAVDVPDRLVFRPIHSDDDMALFRWTVGLVLHGSLDRADQHWVTSVGLDRTVESYVQPDEVFAYERTWWHLAVTPEGGPVGFTQPVIYRDSRRDGLEEGTIHYLGVVPDQRGNGYIDDLLRHATRTLQQVGVWRIFCDTDVENAPMITAFERVGYQRGQVRQVPLRAPDDQAAPDG